MDDENSNWICYPAQGDPSLSPSKRNTLLNDYLKKKINPPPQECMTPSVDSPVEGTSETAPPPYNVENCTFPINDDLSKAPNTANPASSTTAPPPNPVGNYTIPINYNLPKAPFGTVPPIGPWVNQPPNLMIINPTPLDNPPDAHMGYAVFVTIACCHLAGIFAIRSARECRQAIIIGNRELAEKKSKESLGRSHCALVCGILVFVLVAAIVTVRIVFA